MHVGHDHALSLVGIYEISKILGAARKLDSALHDVLNLLASYLQMHHGAVALIDDTRRLHLAAAVGAPAGCDGVVRYPFAAVEKVVATGVAMVEADAVAEPLLAAHVGSGDVLEDEKVSFLCVPIKTPEGIIGALSVERTWGGETRHVFERDIRFLTMVATMIGQAIGLYRRTAPAPCAPAPPPPHRSPKYRCRRRCRVSTPWLPAARPWSRCLHRSSRRRRHG